MPRSISIGTPAAYRIVVRGKLDESYSERLGGLSIRAAPEEPHGHVCALEGRLMDQAQLIGVLNALYGLGLPILEVQASPDERS